MVLLTPVLLAPSHVPDTHQGLRAESLMDAGREVRGVGEGSLSVRLLDTRWAPPLVPCPVTRGVWPRCTLGEGAGRAARLVDVTSPALFRSRSVFR